jgi:hypothetical protein
VGNGEADLLLTDNRLIDAKAWSPQMWQAASERKKVGMVVQIAQEVKKYLGDPAGYTLRFEFRYAIPSQVLLALQDLEVQYGSRLSWASGVT